MSGKFWRNVFYSGCVIFFAMFGYLVVSQKDGQFLCILAAFIALVAARFDDLAKFKLSTDGLEGEMREVIDEARATLAQLHLLAAEQSKLILHNIQSSGRWGGQGIEAQDRVRDSVVTTLKALDVSEGKIAEVLEIEYPFIDFDYSHYVTRNIDYSANEKISAAWQDFFSDDKRKGIGFEPSPDELEGFLSSLGLLEGEVKERLEDYRQFRATRTHRRLAEWRKSR